MHAVWWTGLGLAVGVIVMLPIVRLLLRRGERRARDAERRARDAGRLAELGAMTGGLAHEIRNPLSTILLNAQLLAESIGESDLPDEEKGRLVRRLDSLSREVERLRGILNDFLQFAGRIKIDPQPHDMVHIADELCDFFLPQCEQQGVLLRAQLPNVPHPIEVDESLIKQAALNLMINAVQAMSGNRKRGPHEVVGEIMVRVDGDAQHVRLHIIDTGPGISEEDLERIFHPYVSNRSGGTGLGLPIARRIVEEHGGRLDVDTEPGRGSDFIIELPRGGDASEPRP